MQSLEYNLKDKMFCELFPETVEVLLYHGINSILSLYSYFITLVILYRINTEYIIENLFL